jgi:hypothetical protein
MKVLIISLPRTGSSTLLFKLAEERNLKPIYEPFHDGTNQFKEWKYNPNEDNIIVKTIINQHQNNLDLVKEFDEVILLSRRDLKECAESYAYFMVNVRDGFQSWQEYYYDNITESDYMYALNLISKMNEDIQIISNELNIPITYYEDLFDIESEERLRKYSTKEVKKKKMI